MNAKTAEIFLKCHRGGKHDGDDARLQKALRFAEKDAVLKSRLDEQLAFDRRVASWLGAISAPGELVEKIREIEKPESRPFNPRAMLKTAPALALGIAFLVLIGWGIYYALNRLENFPGKDAAIRMIEVTDEMTGVELEPKFTKAGELEDWLFSKGFEGYYVPPEFAGLKTLGGRVFKQDGGWVAQIAIEEHAMLFYVFRAEDFGIQIEPPDRWRIFEDEDWVAAIREHQGMGFIVAFHGKKTDMQNFLATVAK